MVFSRDNQRIAMVTGGGRIGVWDAFSGERVFQPISHSTQVRDLRFSPDRRLLAAAGDDSVVWVWDAETGDAIHTEFKHGDVVGSISFSPDSSVMASAGEDETVRLWDLRTGMAMTIPYLHEGDVNEVIFSPSGDRIATASEDGTARVWATPESSGRAPMQGHEDMVDGMRFSPDGRFLASFSIDDSVKLWDVQTRRQIGNSFVHDDEVHAVAFSRDSKLLATARSGGLVRFWSTSSGEADGVALDLGEDAWDVMFSPNRKFIATMGENSVQLWNLNSRALLHNSLLHDASVDSMSFARGGSLIATVSDTSIVKLWSVETGELVGEPTDHGYDIHHIRFLADSGIYATASISANSLEGNVDVWDGVGEARIGGPLHLEKMPGKVIFSPSGRSVAVPASSTSKQFPIEVLDVSTGRQRGKPLVHDFFVRDAIFSPDGKVVVTACEKEVRIWDSETGLPLGPRFVHKDDFSALAISPDSRILAIGGDDGTIQLIELPKPVVGGFDCIRDLVESRTGRCIVEGRVQTLGERSANDSRLGKQ